jgi:hypothetical protein
MALQQQPSALRAAVAAASSRQQQQQHQQALAAPGAGAACFGEAPDAWACRSSHDAGIGSPAADAAASHGSGGAAAADAAAGGDAALSPAARVSSGSATAASTAYIARSLAAQGYRVIVRKVLHSKAYWTKSMDNTFIVALDSSSGAHVEYIVDPHFKEVFNVGVMSDNYRCAHAWQVCVRRARVWGGVVVVGWVRARCGQPHAAHSTAQHSTQTAAGSSESAPSGCARRAC